MATWEITVMMMIGVGFLALIIYVAFHARSGDDGEPGPDE
jgi:hypothetical protein